MSIETTINISCGNLKLLNAAVELLNVNRSELISRLLLSALNWRGSSVKLLTRVKYQKSDEENSFRKIHVVFKDDIYEKSIDMRKLYKMSVSFILGVSITKYLYKMINNKNSASFTDNYCSNYVFISNDDGKIYSFTIFWNYPEEKTLIKYLS